MSVSPTGPMSPEEFKALVDAPHGQAIPDDIMRLAGELTNAAIRNYERNRPANIARDAIAKAIHDAVMAERERCAAVVESFAPGGWNYEYGHDDASMRVATRGAILADPKSEG